MHSGSMSFLGSPEVCSGSTYKTYCYIPVTSSAALCSSDVSPTFGLCLPSSFQGNLWLLDNCQDSYGEAPSCESPSCEPKTYSTNCNPSNFSVPCNSPSLGKGCTACETTNVGHIAPSPSPRPVSKGYVSDCSLSSKYASKAGQGSSNGSKYFGQLNYLSKSFRPLNSCRLGSFGYRNYQNLGFSPSSYIASRCHPQSYSWRNAQYSNYGRMNFPPLSYSCRNYRSLSCIPSSFPPLRYLCSGCRPLSCY